MRNWAGDRRGGGGRGGANAPILNRQGAAGVNARPTEPGKHGGHPGNATPVVHRRGGFHIRPVCGGAGFRGRDKSRPYGQIFRFRQTGRPQCLPRFAGEGHGPPAGVRGRAGRADMESAPTWGVRGGGNVPGFEFQRCGGRERPPYGPGKTRRPPGKMQPPRCTVGADSISARFAAARSSAGGINPAPTNKFCALGHQNAPDNTPP